MLRAVIIDNEKQCIEDLQNTLAAFCPEISLTGYWHNLPDAVKGIREQQPDIVFLDIELDGGVTGFDVLEKIPDRSFEVIFVTAFNQYATRAFHFSAIYYIEKPVDGSLLREAVERVKRKRSDNEFRLQLQVLTQSVRNIQSLPQQIILPNPEEGDSIIVQVKDVVRIEATGSSAVFYFFRKGKIEKTLYSLNIGMLQKKMLQGHDDFIMIHESHIVNRNHITHYNSKNHSLQMADEIFISIAKRRVNDFLQKFSRL